DRLQHLASRKPGSRARAQQPDGQIVGAIRKPLRRAESCFAEGRGEAARRSAAAAPLARGVREQREEAESGHLRGEYLFALGEQTSRCVDPGPGVRAGAGSEPREEGARVILRPPLRGVALEALARVRGGGLEQARQTRAPDLRAGAARASGRV